MNANQKNQAVQSKAGARSRRDVHRGYLYRPGQSTRDIARLLLDNRINAVPVVDNDGTPVGMVSWWLQLAAGSQPLDDNLHSRLQAKDRAPRDVISGPLVTVTEDTDVSQIARLFSIHHIKRVPIVCDGRIACLVARADLLHVVAATQSQSTGEDKAKHRGFLSLFGEYKQPAWRVASVESPAAVPLVHARPRKVARQDRAAHRLHQLAAATNRPPPLTHGDASS